MKHRAKTLFFTIVCCLLVAPALYAQDKNVAKAEELLAKGVASTNATEKRELIDKAIDLYEKSGMGKELFEIIGDALVAGKDYASASRYYLRGTTEIKKAGYGKIGDAMVEDAAASGDDKEVSKLIKSAVSNYRKSENPEAGYKKIGDLYYSMGKGQYDTALDYYVMAKSFDDVKKIADGYIAAGQDTSAAKTYERLNTTEGYNAAGAIYEKAGEYSSAYIAYEKAGNIDGLLRYANRLFATGNAEAGIPQYQKIAALYSGKNDNAGLEKLAEAASTYGQYQLSNELYMQINNFTKAEMALVYLDLISFNYDGAIEHATKADDAALAAAIKANKTTLMALEKIVQEFELIKQNEPSVTKQYDENKNLVLSAEDMESFKYYYADYKNKIADLTYSLASNYAKLSNDAIKHVMRTKFSSYGAVRTILDKNFNKKKEKSALKTEDTFL